MRNAATVMMAVLTFQLALHMSVLRECVAQRQPTSLVQMSLFMPFCHGRRSVNIRVARGRGRMMVDIRGVYYGVQVL